MRQRSSFREQFRRGNADSHLDCRAGAERLTVRGSIVGTRLDLQEALEFAAAGKVRATVSTERLENINDVFSRMHAGAIDGRVVLDMHG